jgi:hypothetical protein
MRKQQHPFFNVGADLRNSGRLQARGDYDNDGWLDLAMMG